jgi:CRP-like cAMP-binding protein
MLIHSALRSIPFLQGLPDAEIDWLTLRAGSLHLARGEELFHPGDPVEFAYFLRTGAVALTVETGARTGTVTGLILPTDVLNIIAWTPGAVNLKTATAVVDTDLIAVAAGHAGSCSIRGGGTRN